MGSHPVNLFLRFVLELLALAAIGFWGWKQSDAWQRVILTIGLPLLLAAIWGIFNVPGDPSRSGNAPVVVPGTVRLFIELGFFSLAIWTLYDLEKSRYALFLGMVVIAHYLLSYDRILWLLKQ